LPGKSGLDLLEDLRPHEDQFGVRALKACAEGYMTGESAPEELVQAIQKILVS
jgi:DNA-binding NarL/FixJ family response regulator